MPRVVIEDRETGMVLGDGATEQEAWDDAENACKVAGVTLEREHSLARGYDPDYWEIALRGGIVVLARK